MRKIAAIVTLLTTLLCISAFIASPCFAQNIGEEADIEIYVDGERVESEKKPIIDNSRTLVPIRAVAEKAGIRVLWDGEKYEVSLKYSFTEATLKIDREIMTVYNSVIDKLEKIQLDTVPRIIDGSTYVTLRAALEAVGAGVLWDGDRRAIYIVSPDEMFNSGTTVNGLSENLESYRKFIEKKYGRREDYKEETPKDEPEETPKDEPEELPKDEPEETPKDEPEELPKDEPEETPKDEPEENPKDEPEETPKDEPEENPKDKSEDNSKDNSEEVPDGDTDETPEEEAPQKTAADYGLSFSGFRKMTKDSVRENEIFNLSGKIRSKTPIVLVRCTVEGSELEAVAEYSADEGKKTCDIYALFNKKLKLNKAGVGEHTFKIYACTEDGEEVEVFSYDYTVTEKSKGYVSPNPEKDDGKDKKDEIVDAFEDEETPTLSYYGFRNMTSHKIVEGAPHGLYGRIRSNRPILSVRCMIDGTDMDYKISLSEKNEITEYNVFTYFDKLIRFSEAGLGKNTFKIYAKALGTKEQLLFSYTYTVVKKGADEKYPKDEREQVDVTNPEIPDNVCLPLKGNIRLTSPYGFRAYNKWEFHKGIDIVSDSSRDIICVADGKVVDCATGKNSGAGNYVAIQHDEGWVSLYYHLKSYDVEIGDRVKMGEVIATMGNTGGNYGVHLHFMTCDDWYGGIWATQNNHHTAPHEYVPQILAAVKNYNPNYESVNKDKIILCNFNFPNTLTQGTAYSISKVGGYIATENGVKAVTVTVTDEKGELVMEQTEKNPTCTTDGYYTNAKISVALDKKCRFDKLEIGKYVFRIQGKTENGRERVIYTKAFEIVEKTEKDEEKEASSSEKSSATVDTEKVETTRDTSTKEDASINKESSAEEASVKEESSTEETSKNEESSTPEETSENEDTSINEASEASEE